MHGLSHHCSGFQAAHGALEVAPTLACDLAKLPWVARRRVQTPHPSPFTPHPCRRQVNAIEGLNTHANRVVHAHVPGHATSCKAPLLTLRRGHCNHMTISYMVQRAVLWHGGAACEGSCHTRSMPGCMGQASGARLCSRIVVPPGVSHHICCSFNINAWPSCKRSPPPASGKPVQPARRATRSCMAPASSRPVRPDLRTCAPCALHANCVPHVLPAADVGHIMLQQLRQAMSLRSANPVSAE